MSFKLTGDGKLLLNANFSRCRVPRPPRYLCTPPTSEKKSGCGLVSNSNATLNPEVGFVTGVLGVLSHEPLEITRHSRKARKSISSYPKQIHRARLKPVATPES